MVLVVLFLALVCVWVRGRSRLGPGRQRVVDLQMGGGLCFFIAAWQACGLAGRLASRSYPDRAATLKNQSFLVEFLLGEAPTALLPEATFDVILANFVLHDVVETRSRGCSSPSPARSSRMVGSSP